MNVKLKPPCFVRVKGERVKLRSLSLANAQLKRSGWRGLVAVVQNERGSGLVEYRNLSPDSPSQHAAGVSSTKESGAPSGQTAGVASQKAGQQ